MPNVWNLDRSTVDNPLGRVPPQAIPMCEPAQVLDRGARNGTKERRMDTRRQTDAARSKGPVHWPFLYSYRGDTVIINKAQRTSKYQEALAVGEAQF